MSNSSEHRYIPITKEELQVLENVESSHLEHKWLNSQIRVSLTTVIAVAFTQTLLGIALVIYILHLRQSIFLPLDSRFRDFAGNYYPAAQATRYETRTFQYNRSFITTQGNPTPHTDAAWAELQAPADGTVQLSSEKGFDIDGLHETVESTKTPGLYFYGLEVYHQLHCLDRIRKSFHPDFYFPNMTEHEINYHREHCIEHLRHSIMCNGDFALDYWQYDEETGKNWLKVDIPHVCRDFGAMRDWVLKYQYEQDDWV